MNLILLKRINIEIVFWEMILFIVPDVQTFLMAQFADWILLAANMLNYRATHVEQAIFHDLEDSSTGTCIRIDLFYLSERVL